MDSEAHRSVSLRATRRADRNNTQSHILKDVESGPLSPLVRTPQDYPSKIVWKKGFISLVLRILFLMFDSSICNREGKFMLVLDSLGFKPKPLHRCIIPVADDPDSVVIPEKRTPYKFVENLSYILKDDDPSNSGSQSAPLFGGHESWEQREESFKLNSTKKWVGIWRLVLLKTPPYDEPRRNGKVPKILTHRLYPQAEYSIWIDGKMELIVDPLLMLERYLWRDKNTFAIARHKHHQSIYEEADANKRRKRYARPLIDLHVKIYFYEGMEPWSTKKDTVSDVPEGAIIIREHTALNNLFSCLWFNEVNLFTPRDQLSFGYVVYRLGFAFKFFMFPNCEYNSLFVLHSHTREHSSAVEWALDEFKRGLGLWMPCPGDLDSVSLPHVTRTSQAG
ncbi:hypothetical protein MKX01_006229 [Papaver californicum]|nr:hypothetical protein MKX01_006229 [Papaver californicum]